MIINYSIIIKKYLCRIMLIIAIIFLCSGCGIQKIPLNPDNPVIPNPTQSLKYIDYATHQNAPFSYAINTQQFILIPQYTGGRPTKYTSINILPNFLKFENGNIIYDPAAAGAANPSPVGSTINISIEASNADNINPAKAEFSITITDGAPVLGILYSDSKNTNPPGNIFNFSNKAGFTLKPVIQGGTPASINSAPPYVRVDQKCEGSDTITPLENLGINFDGQTGNITRANGQTSSGTSCLQISVQNTFNKGIAKTIDLKITIASIPNPVTTISSYDDIDAASPRLFSPFVFHDDKDSVLIQQYTACANNDLPCPVTFSISSEDLNMLHNLGLEFNNQSGNITGSQDDIYNKSTTENPIKITIYASNSDNKTPVKAVSTTISIQIVRIAKLIDIIWDLNDSVLVNGNKVPLTTKLIVKHQSNLDPIENIEYSLKQNLENDIKLKTTKISRFIPDIDHQDTKIGITNGLDNVNISQALNNKNILHRDLALIKMSISYRSGKSSSENLPLGKLSRAVSIDFRQNPGQVYTLVSHFKNMDKSNNQYVNTDIESYNPPNGSKDLDRSNLVLVGIKVKTGDLVNAITPLFDKIYNYPAQDHPVIDNNNNNLYSGKEIPQPSGGGYNPDSYLLVCNAGSAVVGFHGAAGDNLNSIGLICRNGYNDEQPPYRPCFLNKQGTCIDVIGNINASDKFSDKSDDKPNNSQFPPFLCPLINTDNPPMFITGINGLADNVAFNAIQGICTPVSGNN